jgi:cellobiose-specific phosphotransferase system component IIA
MSDTTPPMDQARSALERAHRAAIAMDGGELRRALEEAREALDGNDAAGAGTAGAKIAQALADLDNGPLDEMERLLEQVRADLGGAP